MKDLRWPLVLSTFLRVCGLRSPSTVSMLCLRIYKSHGMHTLSAPGDYSQAQRTLTVFMFVLHVYYMILQLQHNGDWLLLLHVFVECKAPYFQNGKVF